jgi:hypothetical protein
VLTPNLYSLGPSTADFAEAFIDWYLLVESNVVVDCISFTFGSTAAMRTAWSILPEFRGGNVLSSTLLIKDMSKSITNVSTGAKRLFH